MKSEKVRKKALLHWVNSLPLSSCLMVNNYNDLADGRIFLDIIGLIKSSTSTEPTITASEDYRTTTEDNIPQTPRVGTIHSVLSFLKSSSVTENENIHHPNALTRMLDAHEPMLISVLSALNELYHHTFQPSPSSSSSSNSSSTNAITTTTPCPPPPPLSIKTSTVPIEQATTPCDKIERLKKQYEVLQAAPLSCSNEAKPSRNRRRRQRPKRTLLPTPVNERPGWNYSTEVVVQRHRDSNKKLQTPPTLPKQQTNNVVGLCLSSLWDPFFKTQHRRTERLAVSSKPTLVSKPPARPQREKQQQQLTEVETVYNVCKWIRSKGIVMTFVPPKDLPVSEFLTDAAASFRDGVVLCQLAALVGHQFGGAQVRAELRETPGGMPGQLTLRGSCQKPRNAAQRHHNVSLALSFLREQHIVSKRHLWGVDDILHGPYQSMWGLLYDIYDACRNPNTMGVVPPYIENPKVTCEKLIVPKRSRKNNNELQVAYKDVKVFDNHVTLEQISSIKNWLSTLGVNLPSEQLAILKDPCRNGVLLCLVVKKISASCNNNFHFHRKPTTLAMAKHNVYTALQHLKKIIDRGSSSIPESYLRDYQSILRGNAQYFWGLLWHIMQKYKTLNVTTNILGNSFDDSSLERSLMSWLQPYIVQSRRKKITAAASSFADIQTELRNGTLLCKIVQDILPSSTRFKGIYWRPMNESSSKSNIQKACELLVKQKILFKGDVDEAKMLCGDCTTWARVFQLVRMYSKPNECDEGQELLRYFDESVPRPSILPTTLIGRDLEKQKNASSPFDLDVPAHVWYEQSAATAESNLMSPRRNESSKTIQELPPRPALKPFDIIPISQRNIVVPKRKPPPPPSEKICETDIAKVNVIIEWLAELRIPLSDKSAMLKSRAKLVEFKDGLLLCSIVERLELCRSIEGLCRDNPAAKASCLHNIRKALHILKGKKKMPLDLLYREVDIYNGNRKVIVPLLLQIRRAYGYNKKKISSSNAA